MMWQQQKQIIHGKSTRKNMKVEYIQVPVRWVVFVRKSFRIPVIFG